MERMRAPLPEASHEAERPVLGKTADGAIVRDRADSHMHTEGGISKHIVAMGLRRIRTGGRRHVEEEVQFEWPVGISGCVERRPQDDVKMVFRKGRNGRTPMVMNREEGRVTYSISIIMNRDSNYPDEKAYTLATCFPGSLATREPWDPTINSGEEFMRCEQFWSEHALVYNEDIIDRERTEAFDALPEEEKRLELLRESVQYSGVFIDKDDLYSKAPATLDRRIETPHITTMFRPQTPEDLNLDGLDSNVRIMAVGYGNDGQNEGLLVRLEADDPEVQKACDALEKPHITLSVAYGAFAKNTASLEFTELDEPIELTGKYGLFIHGKEIFDVNEVHED